METPVATLANSFSRRTERRSGISKLSFTVLPKYDPFFYNFIFSVISLITWRNGRRVLPRAVVLKVIFPSARCKVTSTSFQAVWTSCSLYLKSAKYILWIECDFKWMWMWFQVNVNVISSECECECELKIEFDNWILKFLQQLLHYTAPTLNVTHTIHFFSLGEDIIVLLLFIVYYIGSKITFHRTRWCNDFWSSFHVPILR